MASTSPRPPIQFNAFPHYEPSKAACIIFIVAFGLALVAHVFQSIKAKITYMWPLIAATGLECIGYILRYYVIENPTSKNPSIASQVMIIVTPAILAANLYMLVGRAMIYVGKEFALIRPNWITTIFLGIDIISIATQGLGGTILSGSTTDANKLKLGKNVLIGGLFIQIVGFAVFLFVAVWFDWKSNKVLGAKVKRLRGIMTAFYISGALIMVRSIYRTVEFLGVDLSKRPIGGYLFTHEWPFYVLDATPIFLGTIVFNFIYPANYLPKSKDETIDNRHDNIEMNDGSAARLTSQDVV